MAWLIDYNHYTRKASPPLKVSLATMHILQACALPSSLCALLRSSWATQLLSRWLLHLAEMAGSPALS